MWSRHIHWHDRRQLFNFMRPMWSWNLFHWLGFDKLAELQPVPRGHLLVSTGPWKSFQLPSLRPWNIPDRGQFPIPPRQTQDSNGPEARLPLSHTPNTKGLSGAEAPVHIGTAEASVRPPTHYTHQGTRSLDTYQGTRPFGLPPSHIIGLEPKSLTVHPLPPPPAPPSE